MAQILRKEFPILLKIILNWRIGLDGYIKAMLNGELKDKNINRKEQTLFRAKGYISDKEPKIISKLGIDTEIWLDTVKEYSQSYHSFVGSESQLKEVCESTGKKWLAGIRSSRLLYC